jgi:hypothetical protein
MLAMILCRSVVIAVTRYVYNIASAYTVYGVGTCAPPPYYNNIILYVLACPGIDRTGI